MANLPTRYTVKSGDTLYKIGLAFGIPWQSIAIVNSIPPPYLIYPGEVLTLPLVVNYTVKSGDTLYKIAQNYNSMGDTTTWQWIADLNNIQPPYLIFPGQVLEVPLTSVSGNVVVTPPPTTQISPGQTETVNLTVKNNEVFWVAVLSINPFNSSGWPDLEGDLVTTLGESFKIAPGETATITIKLIARSTLAPGTYDITGTVNTDNGLALPFSFSVVSGPMPPPAGGLETLVWVATNFSNNVTIYGNSKAITTVGFVSYGLDASGKLIDKTGGIFNPSTHIALAHSLGMKACVVVAAGSGLTGNPSDDDGINALINALPQTQMHTGALYDFGQTLASMVKQYSIDEWQMDWETEKVSQSGVASVLTYLASVVHAAGAKISLTSYPYSYVDEYSPASLSTLDHLNLQNYCASNFSSWLQINNYLWGKCPVSQFDLGLGDFNNSECGSSAHCPVSSAAFAGQCVQWAIQNKVTRISVWPCGGNTLSGSGNNYTSPGMYGFSDTVYQTKNYYQLLAKYLISAPSPSSTYLGLLALGLAAAGGLLAARLMDII